MTEESWRAQVIALVERTCAEQGLPLLVSDPVTVSKVSVLLGGSAPARDSERVRASGRSQQGSVGPVSGGAPQRSAGRSDTGPSGSGAGAGELGASRSAPGGRSLGTLRNSASGCGDEPVTCANAVAGESGSEGRVATYLALDVAT
jgi:hypothetical protein